MQIANMKGEPRQPGNRGANRRLRKRGLVPTVIYGHEQEPETVAVSLHDLLLALEHVQHVIRLEIDGQQQQYLIKDVQYDHLQKTPIHVDLMRVDPNERVHVKVPVELKGEPHGVHEGGVLVHVIADIDVECRLLEIPEVIRLDVAHLGVGQVLYVKDIELPEGVEPRHDPDDIVATVRAKRGVRAEEEEVEEVAKEPGKEPEVIGRTGKEEEDAREG
ncbi:MAG TPA: 50S ribosomal protein L25 [Phycisphaerae bacterium]|nr:50S ribosomal protein L25 [Phycisphaerae bacterium]